MVNRNIAMIGGLCLSVLLGGCNSKELTRSLAAKKIKMTFPRRVTAQFTLGRTTVGETTFERFTRDTMGPGIPLSREEPVLSGKWFKALSDAGLIKLDWEGDVLTGALREGIVRIELTNEGKKYAVGEETLNPNIWDGERNVRHIVIKLCDKQFDRVTGIRMMTTPFGEVAQVEFTWKFENATPFEKAEIAVQPTAAQCNSSVPQPAEVGMRLYDDGWRFQ